MTIRNLDFLLRPRSVAVIGASDRERSVGAALMRNLLRGGFRGEVWPVNPKRASVAGLRAFADVAGLPEVPDLAILASPAATLPHIVRALAERGTRAAVVITSVPQRPQDAAALRQSLLDAARPHSMRILGPNSMGLVVPSLGLDASFAAAPAQRGGIAFVSQSGALTSAALDWAASRNIGFSCVVSLGEAIDVDAADIIDYLGSDPATRAVLLYLESVQNGRKFLSAARAASRGKPVIVLKSGRTRAGAQAAMRHTGGDPGDDAVFDAAVRRAGMLRVGAVADLFAAAETLTRAHSLEGDRLVILTNAGGPGVLAVDVLAGAGGELSALEAPTRARLRVLLPESSMPANPVDLGGEADARRYGASLQALLEAPGRDSTLVIHAPSGAADAREVAEACASAARDRAHNLLACWMGGDGASGAAQPLRDAGIAVYETPEAAVQAFLHTVEHRRNQEALRQAPPSIMADFAPDEATARRLLRQALSEGRGQTTAEETRALLGAYGIALGAPPRGRALELALRVTADPAFGLFVRLGRTGAEGRGANAIGLLPLDHSLASEAIMRAGLVEAPEASGAPAASAARAQSDRDALALMLARVSQLVVDHDELRELEIDPLRVDEGGAVALDARVRVAPPSAWGGERLAIRPYPKELEQAIELGGRQVLLRPIKPEDAGAYARFIEATQAPDFRLRFFTLVRSLPARDLARHTQIDYHREMAFVATTQDGPDAGEIAGEVRAFVYPGGTTAEFAILVRSDVKRRGLGLVLLSKMIDYCRASGLAELIGQILPENEAMIALARRCGMQVEVAPGASVAVAHLDLRSAGPQT